MEGIFEPASDVDVIERKKIYYQDKYDVDLSKPHHYNNDWTKISLYDLQVLEELFEDLRPELSKVFNLMGEYYYPNLKRGDKKMFVQTYNSRIRQVIIWRPNSDLNEISHQNDKTEWMSTITYTLDPSIDFVDKQSNVKDTVPNRMLKDPSKYEV